MDGVAIRQALTALGAELQRRELAADLYVVGGAAVAMAYDRSRSTRDVHAIFAPKTAVYEAAEVVASDVGLPAGWLNDAVKGFLLGPDPYPRQVLDLPGVRVEIASAQVVLVMKCLAHRVGQDDDDVALLAGMLGLADATDVLDLVEQMAGPRLLTPQVQFFVEAVLDPGHGELS